MMGVDEQFDAYLSKVAGEIRLDEDTSHWIALMLVAFRMDFFDRTISLAEKSIRSLQKQSYVPTQVQKAINIIREEAVEKVSSQKTIRSSFDWDGHDSSRDDQVARDGEPVLRGESACRAGLENEIHGERRVGRAIPITCSHSGVAPDTVHLRGSGSSEQSDRCDCQ